MLQFRLPAFYCHSNLTAMKKIIPIYRDFQDSAYCSFAPGKNRRRVMLRTGGTADSNTNRLYKKTMLAFGYESSLLPNAMVANNCTLCSACIQLRIAVTDYKFSASERKILRRNKDFTITHSIPEYTSEQYNIYRKHHNAHRDRFGDGAIFSENQYKYFVRLHSHEQSIKNLHNASLKSTLYYDDYGDSLYAAQQIYDPAMPTRHSIGHFGILKLIEFAQQRGDVRHIYIGYWVKDSPTLDYKKRYHSLEAFIDGAWIAFDQAKHTQGPRLPHPDRLSINMP